MDQSEYPVLRSSLERLILNDSSVTITPDSSSALGQGWRIGFLGLLHMEVFTQRLEEVYNNNNNNNNDIFSVNLLSMYFCGHHYMTS